VTAWAKIGESRRKVSACLVLPGRPALIYVAKNFYLGVTGNPHVTDHFLFADDSGVKLHSFSKFKDVSQASSNYLLC